MAWKLVKKIGQGGLGIVHLYKNNQGRHYAVKRMKHKWDRSNHVRFRREIIILDKLSHKNIVKLVGYNVNIQNPWYMMPYYKEGSLRDKMNQITNKNKSFTAAGASGIVYLLASALKYSHRKGIVHRDLKPENILFKGNEPILADWGIGKFIHKESTVHNYRIGTPSYCAPEQWEKGISDSRSDIYSLGLVYRELLTGSVSGEVQNNRIRQIIDTMTHKNPEKRYTSMHQVMVAIRELNIISVTDPLEEFTKTILTAGFFMAGFYLLAKAART